MRSLVADGQGERPAGRLQPVLREIGDDVRVVTLDHLSVAVDVERRIVVLALPLVTRPVVESRPLLVVDGLAKELEKRAKVLNARADELKHKK